MRKLLALATSPNVHEAAAAAARAQSLIERHRLEGLLAEPTEGEAVTDGAEAPLERSRKLRTWRVLLAQALAEPAGCVAYRVDGPDGQELRLVGRDEDRESVRVLWEWLVDRIQWLSATEGGRRSKAWHEAFRIGAVETIAERLVLAGQEAREGLAEAALVRVDPKLAARRMAVEDFVATRMSLGRGRSVRVDARAWAKGRQAGKAVPLPEGRRALAAGRPPGQED